MHINQGDVRARRRVCTARGVYSSGVRSAADAFRLASTDAPAVGHRAAVLALALSTDSLMLASGDALGSIYLWDVSDEHAFARTYIFKGHKAAVTVCGFTIHFGFSVLMISFLLLL